MKKSITGFASVMLASLSFGAWYDNPMVKAKVDLGDWSSGTDKSDPHYIDLSESGAYLMVGLDSWQDLYPTKLFRSSDLAAAAGDVADLAFKTVSPDASLNQKWKGGAVSEKWGVAVTGSGNTTKHAVMALNTEASAELTLAVKSDGLDFDADGRLYGNNADMKNQLVRYSFSALSAAGGTVSATKTFDTSLARVRNVSVYTIGGKALVFCGEGDSTKAAGGKVIAVDIEAAQEYELVTAALAADVMNVKVIGLAAGAPKLCVMSANGELAVYALAADGLSVTSSTPLKALAASDLIPGATVAADGFRSFEVTDDGARAFLSVGQRYSGLDRTYIYVLQEKPTELEPVAAYAFEDGSVLGKDSVGDHPLATMLGDASSSNPTTLASGKVGQACTMARTSSVTGAAMISETPLVSGNGPCTFSCWVKPDSGSSLTGYIMMQKYLGTGKPGAWSGGSWTGAWYVRFATDGYLQFVYNTWKQPTADDTASIRKWIGKGKYEDNTWHHVAITHDGNGKITLYWDGAALNSKTMANVSFGANTRFLIGSYEKSNGFSGSYDEVKVYDVALSAEQIKAEYDGTAGKHQDVYADLDENTVVDALADTTVSTTLSAAAGKKLIKTGAGTAEVSKGTATAAEVWAGTLAATGKNVLGDVTSVTVGAGSVFDIARTDTFGGTLAGDGTVRFSGLGKINLTGTSPLSLAGTYQLYAANVDVAAPVTARPTIDVANGGTLAFGADATVKRLQGAGVCGAVSVADGQTLTIDDPAAASYAGVLKGAGTVAKNGVGELVLEKSPEVANLAVTAGQVTLDRALPYYQKNLVAYWNFDDADNLGKDVLGKADLAEARTADGEIVQCVGHSGAALSLRKGATKVASGLIADAGVVPTGKNPFSVSAWIRPDSNSKLGAYVMTCRKIGGGCPDGWTENDWNGWNVRFVKSGYWISADFQSGWRDHVDDEQCVMGSLGGVDCHADGRWHHLVLTRAADGTANLYWDGQNIGNKKLTKNQNVADNVRFEIGGQDSGNSFSGDFDEVKIFKSALTADEVKAEFSATMPVEDNVLPAPDAHWTFDELVEVDGKKIFRDASANAIDLKNTANKSGELVECVTGEGINGGAAYLHYAGAYLQLDDGKNAANAIQATWPSFTISARIRNVSATGAARKPLVCIGNLHSAEGGVRLSYEGRENTSSEPQVIRVFPGDANGGNGYAMTDTLSTASDEAPWTTVTLVNDHQTQKMWIYRDGVLVDTVSTAGSYTQSGNKTSMNFDLSRLDIGYNTYNTYSGYMIDDLRIYKKLKPTAAQVKAIVLEQAGLVSVPSPVSSVALAAGTTLAVKGGTHAAAAVSGAGRVDIATDATFGVVDWSGFTGTLTGYGRLALYAKLPATLDIGTREMIVAGAVTDKARSGLPVLTTTGKVSIAETGVFRFTDITSAKDLPAGCFVIAEAKQFVAPSDFTGWTLENAGPRTEYSFKISNGKFMLKIKGGFAIIIR